MLLIFICYREAVSLGYVKECVHFSSLKGMKVVMESCAVYSWTLLVCYTTSEWEMGLNYTSLSFLFEIKIILVKKVIIKTSGWDYIMSNSIKWICAFVFKGKNSLLPNQWFSNFLFSGPPCTLKKLSKRFFICRL